jgi:hypothetical protein
MRLMEKIKADRKLSDALLPLLRVATGVETGNDKQCVIVFNYEKQRVRKPAQESAAHILERNRKLPGICAHAFNEGINCSTKAPS